MTEVAHFSEFIKQHRFELPSVDGISSLVDEMSVFLNKIASDYRCGNYSKWVDQLLAPNTHGVKITRQDAEECVFTLCEEKERILGLAHLFVQEVARYDRVFGQPACVTEWDSSEHKVQRANFLLGLALGSVPNLHEPATPQVSKAAPEQKKWSFEKTVIVVELLLNLYNTHQSGQPNAQMAELIDLQKQKITAIQQIDERIASGLDRIGNWVISFGDAYEERTETIDAQTEAIKENTEAVEKLIEKMEETENKMETQDDNTAEDMPECGCSCHDFP